MGIRHNSEESLSFAGDSKKQEMNTTSRSYGKISDVPDSPTIGTATDVGTAKTYNNASATVVYTSAATGGAATTFTATSTPGSFTGTGASPITVNGLQSATAYTFAVTAANTTGSQVSTNSGSITATSVPQTPTIGSPSVATNQAYTGSASVSVPFTPGASGGKTVSTYTVTSSSGATSSGTSPIAISDVVGTARTYTVTATNANGVSAASSASSLVTPVSVPQAPTIGTATVVNSTKASVAFTTANCNTANPSFEGNVTTGYAAAGATLTSSSAFARTGTYSMLSTVISSSDTNIAYLVSTTAPSTGTYTASAWFYVPTGSAIAGQTVGLSYEGANGTAVSSTAATLTAGAWRQATLVFTMTSTSIGPIVARTSFLPSSQVGALIYSDDWQINSIASGGSFPTAYTVTSNAGGFTGTGLYSPISVTGSFVSNQSYTFTVTSTNANGTSSASSASNFITPLATTPSVTYLVVAGGGAGGGNTHSATGG